ncbi:MAG: hypothetical protein P4K98_01500 [Bryobacteraceae bacterium]|nr:hypothetical protein [Bryobacteraceae bacterium]
MLFLDDLPAADRIALVGKLLRYILAHLQQLGIERLTNPALPREYSLFEHGASQRDRHRRQDVARTVRA